LINTLPWLSRRQEMELADLDAAQGWQKYREKQREHPA
jgi:hypothetical protein